MKKSVFYIKKMDCPSEERIIRMKLEEVTSLKKLEFSIPDRTMIAFHDGDPTEILNKLIPLNFDSSLSDTFNIENDIEIDNKTNESEARVLKVLLALNAGMFFIEFFFGLYAESMGLISDSFDMLADASVYVISFYAVGKSLVAKKRSAQVNGYFQILLGAGVLIETIRRFMYGSDPEPSYMILISLLALAVNVYCLYLLSGHKEKGVHMKASYICSSNDVIANVGVILAGVLVFLTNSIIPDLVIGLVVAGFVVRGAFSILKLAD